VPAKNFPRKIAAAQKRPGGETNGARRDKISDVNDRARANHFALIRSFLIDSGRYGRLKRRSAQKIFDPVCTTLRNKKDDKNFCEQRPTQSARAIIAMLAHMQ
jgi:hypothetical protein